MQILTPNGIASSIQLGVSTITVDTLADFHSIMHGDLLNVFFNKKEFAIAVAYTHVTGEIKSYSGIFDEPYAGMGPGSELQVMSATPQVRIRQSELARYPAKGDKCAIKGVVFVVDSARPDGLGVVTIFLQRKDRQ